MTPEEGRKADAEIARLMAEASRLTAEAARLGVETAKLSAEANKVATEDRYYPFIMMTGAVGALAALITAIVGAVRLLS